LDQAANNNQSINDKSEKQPEAAVFVAEKLKEVNQVIQESLAGLSQAKLNLEKMINGEGEVPLGEVMLEDTKAMHQVVIDASQQIRTLQNDFLGEFEKENKSFEEKKSKLTDKAQIEELEKGFIESFGGKVVELNNGLREVLHKITEGQEKMKHDMISLEIELLREIIKTL